MAHGDKGLRVATFIILVVVLLFRRTITIPTPAVPAAQIANSILVIMLFILVISVTCGAQRQRYKRGSFHDFAGGFCWWWWCSLVRIHPVPTTAVQAAQIANSILVITLFILVISVCSIH